MITAKNITSLNGRRSATPLPQTINIILNTLRKKSENTESSYRGYYREFFMYTLGKKMEDVSWDDILSISYVNVLEYVDVLSVTNASSTINTKVASLKTLYKHLYKTDSRIDTTVVDIAKVVNNEEEAEKLLTDTSWGSLTEEEVKALLKYCSHLPDNEKPLIKELFFETAFITAIRQGALLSMKWKNLIPSEDKSGISVWTFVFRHKGANHKVPISDEFYEKLSSLKNIIHSDGKRDGDDDKIFNISDKTLRKTLSDFCKFHGIAKERNIVLHSLKKASCDMVESRTKDLRLTAKHGQHKSFDMVYKTYVGKNDSLIDKPSYSLFEKEIDTSKLEELSLDQLLEAIKKCGQGTINEIISKIE